MADWLKPEERTWLRRELQLDEERYGAAQHHNLLDAFRLPAVWVLAGVYIIIQIGVYIVNLWMPLILSGLAHGDGAADASLIARYATVPYVLAAIFTVVLGWSSTGGTRDEGILRVAWLWRPPGLPGLRVHIVSRWRYVRCRWWRSDCGARSGPFWALTTRMIGGAAAAGGVAIITMVGAVGGFLGPYVTGRLRDATHSFEGGLYLISGLALAAAMLALAARGSEAKPAAECKCEDSLDNPAISILHHNPDAITFLLHG